MPTPAVTLRLKRFRRRFGITAPRVVVRSHWPWQVYAALGALALLVVILLVWLALRNDEVRDADQEILSLRQQISSQEEELILLRSTAGTEQNTLRMERSTQQQLVQRIKLLEAENAALREEALVFERLVPATGDVSSLRIENFQVVVDTAGVLRYRLLFAYQASKQAPDFRGQLRFVVKFSQGNNEKQLNLPEGDGKKQKAYQLEFRHLLRKEGTLELPRNGRLKSIEAQVWSADTQLASRLAQP